MPAGAGGKRKRGDRSWSGDSGHDGQRPSPHRPGNLNLAQHNQPQSPSSRQGSGDHTGRRRRPSRGGRTPSGRVQTVTQDRTKPATDSSMAAPSNAAPETRQVNGAGPRETPSSEVQTSAYPFEYVTQVILDRWLDDGKRKIVSQCVNARNTKDLITLGCIFQELIRAVLARKLEPSEAGETVKQILADNNGPKSEARHSDDTSTSSFFLNTLSILAEETNVSTEALKSFILATGISPALLRLELDTNLVQGLGLVRETFTRIGIRKQTNVLYRQSNYNLLREESEGYSKLVTELFTTSNTESPSSEIVEETFERVKAMIGAFDLDVGRVLDVTLDVFAAVLVKKYHFFVRFLRASSWWPKGDRLRREEEADFISGLPRWAIPGWTGYDDDKKEDLARARDERDRLFWDRVREIGIRAFFEIGRRPLSDEDKEAAIAEASNQPGLEAETRRWIEETGTLPPKGNRVAAQLLGFKLRFYSTAAREAGYLPENLIWVAALLIKIGFISLRDLYPHLWRDDDLMPELEEKVKKEKLEREMKAKPGGGINALMLAGALPDDTVPTPVSRPRDADARSGTPANDSEAATIKDDEEKEPSPEIREQKVDLLKSLMTIGAVPEALYMLSRFPWLMDIPELPDYIHRIVHQCLSKLYTPLRPMQGTDHIRAVKPIPSLDQSGVPKGQVRLIEAPPRKLLRWAHPDKEDREDGINYRFYWDHWADTIPVCQSVDDFFGLASSLLNVSGFRIGQDPLLMSKIARIAQNSLSQDDSETNKNRWRDFCKRLFLPALSLSKKNPGVANEVFAVIRHFPRAVRYNMYAEWHFGQTSRQPEIKSAFDLATAQTRDTLKRLSKTNIKAMARALAEIAYANPGIVINVEITQIESYDNLIDVVVECARYFTDLGYDILAWALINSLGQKGRSRVQQGGMLTSRWLNALSTFTGKAFKRYSVLNPTPILQYVLEQLRHQNSTDLIVLERIVSSMAGIVTDTNFNDAQIQGMAGGSLLQAQTMLQLLDKRHESRTTSKRLMKALIDSKLAGQLLIAIAQERLLCVYRESEMVPELKLLGNIFDEIHRILTQYLDLLRSNLTIAEFDAFVPGLPKLIGEFGLQPDIAFWITRPSLSKQIADADRNSRDSTSAQTLEAGVPASETVDGDVEMTEGEIAEKKEDKPADGEMDVDNPSSSADSAGMTDVQPNGTTPSPQPSPWHPVLRGLMDELEPVLSPDVWQTVGLPFYVTFWQLSLYDVHIPGKAYEDEIERQKRRAFVVSNDRSDLSIAGTQKKEREKKQIQELQERLLEENKQHLISYEHIRNRLQREKDHWFPSMRGKYEALNLALLEQCFLPRLLLSPIDSFYSFKMMKFLHVSGTPNFRTVGLLDQLFREHRLTAIIFQCTSKEADNFGKFLNEVLRDLTRWHSDRALYEKEAWGTNKTLPGFAMNVDAEGKPTSFVDYEMFRRLLYKWHRLLAGALKTCFNGGEYMHIRNAISVLKAVSQHFPAVNWMGRDMLQCVNSLSNDEREDVKIPAASLKGDFSRREKEWLLPQAFMINENLAGDKGKARPSRTDTAIPKQLNAQAAEFKPPGANGTLNDKMEVEDGEIEDAKMADAAKVTRLPANEEAIVERAKLQKGAAEALSSVDKVERTTLAQEEKRLLPEAEQQLTSTTMKESDNARARTASPAQSRHTSRPPDLNNAASIPKRPDLDRVASQPARLPPPPNLPNKPEPPRGYRHDSRSVRQSDLKDDRRDSRHMDSSRSSRHPDSDRDRLHDRDSRAPSRVDRDRAGAGPPSDDQFRPPRDARGLHREPEAERPGPSRSSDSFSRDGPPGSRPAALPHPDRADRIALIESDNQHRDPARPDRDDRRNRLQSPPRTEARRGPRHDDYPTAPRSDRAGRTDVLEGRDTRPMRQIEPPSDIPSGPRSRAGPSRGRNASMSQPSVPPGTPSGPSDRQPPTGPSGRSSGRGLDSAAPSPAGDKGDTIGVHPDRLKNLQVTSEASPASSRSQAPLAPPSGPRSSQGHISGSPVMRGPPPGPGNDRNRGDKRFAGINNMLQQSGGSQDRSGQGTMIRGRGRQASSTNVPSLHEGGPVSPQVGGPEEIAAQEKTELFPSTRDEDNRSAGRSRRSDATTQEANRESKRSGRHAGPPDTPDRDRRDEEENTRAGRRDERRDRGRDRDRDRDRDRNRRNDNVEDELHQTGRDSGGRRTTGGRDDHRKRDRRDREDGPSGEIAGPGNGDHHGRTRPSSSHNNNNNPPPPLPPPPAPSGPANEERRWGSGRGENRERDRNRDRGGGGRDRERDYNRDGGPVSGSNTLPRKRGRPGDDLHGHGDGGNRGMRAGSESKRARRGT